MATPESDSISTSVYRYYDAADVLIYVGVTSQGTARNQQHNADKSWWQWVSRQEVEHFPTRAEALTRERALIKKFRPPFNSIHNQDAVEIRATYIFARTWGLSVNEAHPPHASDVVRKFVVPIAHADYPNGCLTVLIGGLHSRAALRLQHVPNVGVFEYRANGLLSKKIGVIANVQLVGAVAHVTLQMKPGQALDFEKVRVWVKPDSPGAHPQHYTIKEVIALREQKLVNPEEMPTDAAVDSRGVPDDPRPGGRARAVREVTQIG